MGKALIPSCGPGYDRFFKKVVDYTDQMCGGPAPRWTHIPQTEQTALADAYADWYTGYSRTFTAHTKADTAAMKAAYTRSKKILSRFIKVWFRGFPDIVTAEHLANMDIPPINDTRSPVLEPDNQVEACSKCRRHFELGVCAWRKLHTINTWSFGVTKTPRQCA